jgi:serine/threonine protein kinase
LSTDLPVSDVKPVDAPVSDVKLIGSMTGAAPSFPAATPLSPLQPATPIAPAARPATPVKPPPRRDARPEALLPGARVDDFEVVRMLGRGAFGNVYLARQVTLDRLVALKVSANRGSEGRTMARLEHQHIVQVFSETVDVAANQRLLCMQLVPGTGLEKLISGLHTRPADQESEAPPQWDGKEVLATIDRNATMPPVLDPSALKDREALAQMDAVEATAWFGSRLAEALDFAHRNGVLHRDIKPANILVDSYGRPMLADFNISSHRVGDDPQEDEMFGGTFAYMAPEHLDAFNPDDDTQVDAVTAQSDMYSLALVLDQMLNGRLAFPLPDRDRSMAQILRQLTDQRRAKRPACHEGTPNARKALERTISRCLEPAPADRFERGADLAEQLDGCRRLRRVERQLLPPARFMRGALTRPFVWLLTLQFVPQFVGSFVNFLYNFTQIARPIEDLHKELFKEIAIGYNLIVYPTAISLIVLAVRPVMKCWRGLESCERLTEEEVGAARRQALRLPIWFAVITACAWYIGGLLIPLVVKFLSPENSIVHFMLAHCVSGLIALAYSTCGTMYVVIRVLYPAMWQNTRGFTATARKELAPIGKWLVGAQYLAASIPLVAAVFILVVGDTADSRFRVLTTGLIGLGLVGFYIATTVARRLSQVIATMTEGEGKSGEPNAR